MEKGLYTTGSIYKSMLKFAFPFMLGTILQNLYGAVDLLVVGQFATTADVAAVTIGSQVMTLVTQFVIGFATAITVLVGQQLGAKKEQEIAHTVGTSIVFFTTIAVFFTIVYLMGNSAIISLMQTPPEAIMDAKKYLFTCSIGIIFIVGYNVISSLLMGMGNTKTPFLFVAIACIINIVLDVILVKYVHMGALGAAIATVIAQAGSVLFSLFYLKKKGLGFAFSKSDIRLDKNIMLKIFKIGTPVAIQNALVNASFLFITAIINQLGLIASAAVGVVEKLFGFLAMAPAAFGSAVAAISAQNLGAGEYVRAKKSMWCGIILSLIPSVFIFIFCQFGGSLLASLFTRDSEVIQLATLYLKSYSFDCILISFIFNINGYLNSSGHSWFSMLHSLITTFLVRMPFSFFFSRMENTSLFKIGWAAPLSTLISIILCAIFFRWIYIKNKVEHV